MDKSEMNPMTFCREVNDLIGNDLRSLGAVEAGNVASEDEEACVFRVQGRLVVIRYKTRDGATCFVSGPNALDHRGYESWASLWNALGMDRDIDTDDGLMAYLDMFPEDHRDYIRFIGQKLKEYFAPGR